jgi:hypothetical protein
MQKKKKKKTRDIIQGGDTKRGIFLSIWPYNQCQPLTKKNSIVKTLLTLVIEFSIINVNYKDLKC